MVGALESRTATTSVLIVGANQTTFYSRRGKRMLDVVVSLTMLVALSPALLIVAIASRLSLNKGLFFRQERVGIHGEAFECLKFRTMEHDRRGCRDGFDGSDRRLTHKSADDPRHTSVGRVMRKFSLDELPQLVNVLKGDMSLVGPRPELVAVATDEFIDHPRHWVRPGLTGPFQLSELRRTGDLTTGLGLDAQYVGSLSLVRDVGYLLSTVVMVFKGQGA